jgi:hypothetical protein
MTYQLPMLPETLLPPPASFKPRESFSPSQLAAFGGEGGCKRKWALRSLFGVAENKKSLATTLGTLIHCCLEHYMKGRTVYDLVAEDGTLRIGEKELKEISNIDPLKLAELVAEAPKRALAGLHYLPNINDPALEKREVERWIEIDTTKIMIGVKPIKINGKIDLSIRRAGVWYLYDHKSTKGKPPQKGLPARPWAYVKTPEQLMKDPQSVFYSLDIMLRHNLDSLWCRWVYYLTDTKAHPQAMAVDVELKREDVFKAAYEWLLVAVEMRELVLAAIAGTLTLEDIAPAPVLPPEPNSPCDAFGGCPYHFGKGGPCMPEGEVKLGSLILTANKDKKEETVGLQETFAATQAALSAPLMPPPLPGNPLNPPEAYAAPAVTLPPGFEMGPAGMRAIAPAGYQYNAANGLELVPPTVVAAPPPPAAVTTPPIPEQPAPEAKAKGRPKKAVAEQGTQRANTSEDVMDLLFVAAKSGHPVIGTLTVAQVNAIREVVEFAP